MEIKSFGISPINLLRSEVKLLGINLLIPLLGSVDYWTGVLIVFICFIIFRLLLAATNNIPLSYKRSRKVTYMKFRYLLKVAVSRDAVTFFFLESGIIPRKEIITKDNLMVLFKADYCHVFGDGKFILTLRKAYNYELFEYLEGFGVTN